MRSHKKLVSQSSFLLHPTSLLHWLDASDSWESLVPTHPGFGGHWKGWNLDSMCVVLPSRSHQNRTMRRVRIRDPHVLGFSEYLTEAIFCDFALLLVSSGFYVSGNAPRQRQATQTPGALLSNLIQCPLLCSKLCVKSFVKEKPL